MQPTCDRLPGVEGGPALGRTWAWVVGAIGIASGIGSAVMAAKTVIEGVEFVYALGTLGGVTLGVGTVAIGGALLGAFTGVAIVLSKGTDRLQERPGLYRCYGGIVNGIARPFRSGEDWLFPYAAQHDRVDLVVKHTYWALVEAAPAAFVWCNTDTRTSPLVRSYFKSNQLKAAVTGAFVGAAVGAIAGIVAGYLAGVALAAAIGSAACAASLWFYLLCLALVILVALVVALVLTLVAAAAGGDIGASSAGSGTAPSAPGGGEIVLGQYITLNANLAIYGEDRDAWVAWWVDVTTSPPVLHGTSMAGEGPGGGAPFNFIDADSGFTDACPAP